MCETKSILMNSFSKRNSSKLTQTQYFQPPKIQSLFNLLLLLSLFTYYPAEVKNLNIHTRCMRRKAHFLLSYRKTEAFRPVTAPPEVRTNLDHEKVCSWRVGKVLISLHTSGHPLVPPHLRQFCSYEAKLL